MNTPNAEQKKLIEKYGVMFKGLGGTAVMGKVFGYLLMVSPPFRTFDEIQNDLKLSKGSVSNTLKIMELQGLVEYFTEAGDRKRYFKLSLGNWELIILRQIEETKKFLNIMQEALLIRDATEDDNEKEIRKFIEVNKLMLGKMMELIKEVK